MNHQEYLDRFQALEDVYNAEQARLIAEFQPRYDEATGVLNSIQEKINTLRAQQSEARTRYDVLTVQRIAGELIPLELEEANAALVTSQLAAEYNANLAAIPVPNILALIEEYRGAWGKETNLFESTFSTLWQRINSVRARAETAGQEARQTRSIVEEHRMAITQVQRKADRLLGV